MIAASGIFVVVAFVTLIVGVFQQGLSLIWTSIAASVLAAIFLALGVVQTNKRRISPATGTVADSTTVSPWSDGTATAVLEREPAPAAEGAIVEEKRPSLTAVPGPSDEEMFAPTSAEAPGEPKTRTRKAAATAATVVVVPDRDKYHKDTCRYAQNAAAMTMTKTAARRQGYQACGVCKP